MQDPQREIEAVINRVINKKTSPGEIKQLVNKVFLKDAKFEHPLFVCRNRKEIYGLYEWWRLQNFELRVAKFHHVVVDLNKGVVFTDVDEHIHHPSLPFLPFELRIISRFDIEYTEGVGWQVAKQTDSYSLIDIMTAGLRLQNVMDSIKHTILVVWIWLFSFVAGAFGVNLD